jgi:cytochrome c oxidase subunit 2
MLEYFNQVASSYAGETDRLMWLITWLVGFWFVLAEVGFFWLMFRYRRKKDVKAEYITGKEPKLHRLLTWSHTAILIFDVVILVAAIRVWVIIKQYMPPAERTVKVMSQQWAWTFTDPGPDNRLDTADDIRTTDEMHLEVNKTYHFLLESKDVLHSFYVPAFRLKQDALPGRIYTGWFRPIKTGTFDLQCAEICGVGHGVMGARVYVESAQEHLAWAQAHAGENVVATAAAPADSSAATPAPATAPSDTSKSAAPAGGTN